MINNGPLLLLLFFSSLFLSFSHSLVHSTLLFEPPRDIFAADKYTIYREHENIVCPALSFIMFLFIVFIPDAFAALFFFLFFIFPFFFVIKSRSQLNRKDQRTLEPMRTRIFKEDESASAISYLRVRHSREGNARRYRAKYTSILKPDDVSDTRS